MSEALCNKPTSMSLLYSHMLTPLLCVKLLGFLDEWIEARSEPAPCVPFLRFYTGERLPPFWASLICSCRSIQLYIYICTSSISICINKHVYIYVYICSLQAPGCQRAQKEPPPIWVPKKTAGDSVGPLPGSRLKLARRKRVLAEPGAKRSVWSIYL